MKKIYGAAQIVLFFLIVCLLLGFAAIITERKESKNKYYDFMELSDQIDVLFFGSSHVLNGINPVQLYSEYGITAYNMGKPGGMVTESYWTFMNALDYCTPKCVVVDIWALDRDYHYLDIRNGGESGDIDRNSVSLLHTNMDIWPLTRTKVAAINDLIADPEIRKEFLWDFSLYHTRWSSLNSDDFVPVDNRQNYIYLMGSEPRREIYLNAHLIQADDTAQVLPGKTVCTEYLDKIINVCEERDIEVILTFLPMAISYDQDRQAVNTVSLMAVEKGIPFLNLLPHETQSVIDFYTDMSDDTHLNANGMRKVTSCIGSMLRDYYALPDHRGDSEYASWNTIVEEWQTSEISTLCSQTDLYLELGAIQNINASVLIFMRGDSKAIHDSLVRRFIKQLTGSSVIDEAMEMNGPYLLIRDASGRISNTPICYEFGGAAQPDNFETILGTTTYIGVSDFGAVYVNEDFDNNFLDMEKHYADDVQIIILGQQGEVISHLYYNADW